MVIEAGAEARAIVAAIADVGVVGGRRGGGGQSGRGS